MQSCTIGTKQEIPNSWIRTVGANEQISRRRGSIFEDGGHCIIGLGRLNSTKPFPELEAIALIQPSFLARAVQLARPGRTSILTPAETVLLNFFRFSLSTFGDGTLINASPVSAFNIGNESVSLGKWFGSTWAFVRASWMFDGRPFSKGCLCPVDAEIPIARTSVEVGFALIDRAGYAERLQSLGY